MFKDYFQNFQIFSQIPILIYSIILIYQFLQVHLFHLPGQRYVGLRFLIRYFFGAGEGIQDASRGHDSIEDAWGALRLFKKYEELKKDGLLDEVLSKLYLDGHRLAWKN